VLKPPPTPLHPPLGNGGPRPCWDTSPAALREYEYPHPYSGENPSTRRQTSEIRGTFLPTYLHPTLIAGPRGPHGVIAVARRPNRPAWPSGTRGWDRAGKNGQGPSRTLPLSAAGRARTGTLRVAGVDDEERSRIPDPRVGAGSCVSGYERTFGCHALPIAVFNATAGRLVVFPGGSDWHCPTTLGRCYKEPVFGIRRESPSVPSTSNTVFTASLVTLDGFYESAAAATAPDQDCGDEVRKERLATTIGNLEIPALAWHPEPVLRNLAEPSSQASPGRRRVGENRAKTGVEPTKQRPPLHLAFTRFGRLHALTQPLTSVWSVPSVRPRVAYHW